LPGGSADWPSRLAEALVHEFGTDRDLWLEFRKLTAQVWQGEVSAALVARAYHEATTRADVINKVAYCNWILNNGEQGT
jgi:hypothetical protein